RVHHGEGWIDGMVICEDDPGSGKREIIWHVLRSDVIGAKPIPNKDDDLARRPAILWLCAEGTSQAKHNPGQSTRQRKGSHVHGSAPCGSRDRPAWMRLRCANTGRTAGR